MSFYEQLGALILRLVVGLIFFVHGLDKFLGGFPQVTERFSELGLPEGLAYGVAILELIGGFALLIGVATRVMAALFALLMVGAIFIVKLEAGFIGGFEFDLALLAMTVYLFLNGSKNFSLISVTGFFSRKVKSG
ncbi:DoxX family protein [Texcoconibacillus texcoconensis]|uniref:Putative membrane protein YphA (DoxX/SURF4 family) n=1 Tax=Texcoconibacillus texcoconensis TaxID=1095777 RepID=A0A840QTQ3_9BACI|nr:DoxX family protein [Texcoconibacillus texcoconensis]MBB5174693.1 putative membrane protein YphA (DoxX/SURF4 family) [Texcoconibacillus texcoconensis]